jgi:N-methylhydantoinase A
VTDADLVLGKLDPDNFAGGSIELNLPASAKAIQVELGDKLDMDVETAAYGLVEVVDENMATAARVHAVENGEDLSKYTMIAFGGAAPLHAGRLCEKLGVERLLVPRGAGVGSAIGFLRAPFSFEANRSVFMKLSDFRPSSIAGILTELGNEATSFVRGCDAHGEILSEYKVYMRYSGQGWEIPISLNEAQAKNPNSSEYQALFEQDYTRLFGRKVDGMDIEITVWSVNATTKVDPVEAIAETVASSDLSSNVTQASTRKLFDPARAQFTDAGVVSRESLHEGDRLEGPAVIVEDETTIILPNSRYAVQQSDGCIDIRAKAEVA